MSTRPHGDHMKELHRGHRIFETDLFDKIHTGSARYYSDLNPYPVTSLREARSDIDVFELYSVTTTAG